MRMLARAAMMGALFAGPHAYGQWAEIPGRSFPRTPSGEPDLTAPVPRAVDRKPDLSGVWMSRANPLPPGVGPSGDVPPSQYMINVTADYEPEDLELAPWAARLFRARLERSSMDHPQAFCRPSGVPFLNAVPLPYKIIQTPDLILILYEENTVFRQIFLDGREPVEDPLPRWMGYSIGRWDGDVLVVETVGMTDESWLDEMGHPHSESMHVTERFRRPDAGHLEIETTIDDPDTYSKPFTYTVTAAVIPNDELLEYFCADYERSSEHYQAP